MVPQPGIWRKEGQILVSVETPKKEEQSQSEIEKHPDHLFTGHTH